MQRSMNGLVNLYGINDINTTGNINSKSYEQSNSLYFVGLSGNIQAQINRLMNNYSSIITISGSYENVSNTIVNNIYQTISGFNYNINNTITNNSINQNAIDTLYYSVLGLSGLINNCAKLSTSNTFNAIQYFTKDLFMNNNNIYFKSSGDKSHYIGYGNNFVDGPYIKGYSAVGFGIYEQDNVCIINSNGITINIGNITLKNVILSSLMIGYLSNVNSDIQTQFNSLSGLIYLKSARGIDGINGLNGSNGRDGRDAGGSSSASGGAIGSIINGIGTIGLGAATAFGFSTVFAALADLQLQLATSFLTNNLLVAKIESIQTIVFALETQIESMRSLVIQMEAALIEVQARTIFLNANTITCDLIVVGSINQVNVNPFTSNQFSSNVLCYENVYVAGVLQSFIGIPQF
jgi:hypothetical protein